MLDSLVNVNMQNKHERQNIIYFYEQPHFPVMKIDHINATYIGVIHFLNILYIKSISVAITLFITDYIDLYVLNQMCPFVRYYVLIKLYPIYECFGHTGTCHFLTSALGKSKGLRLRINRFDEKCKGLSY